MREGELDNFRNCLCVRREALQHSRFPFELLHNFLCCSNGPDCRDVLGDASSPLENISMPTFKVKDTKISMTTLHYFDKVHL